MASLAQGIWKALCPQRNVKGIVRFILSRVIAKKSVPSVMNEKALLADL